MKGCNPIMIFAGGTGGHVFPALAVARKIEQEGIPVVWVGTEKGIESKVVPSTPYQFETISIGGLRGKDMITLLFAPIKMGLAGLQTVWLMLKHWPCAVLGMGGFVSGSGGLVAALFRRPLIIHEQNAIAGLTNRILAPFARCVLVGFPNTIVHKNIEVVGNPVRMEISQGKRELPVAEPADRPLRILVAGGSQGAHVLNQTVPLALATLAFEERPEIWHQSGQYKLDFTVQQYEACNVEARVDAFIDSMHEAYAWADLVISRAGAITVAELALAGVGAILVPYPHAVDNHQMANASALVKADAALLIQEHEFTVEALAGLLRDLNIQRFRVKDIAKKIQSFAKPQAANHVASICMQVCLDRNANRKDPSGISSHDI